MIDRFKRQFIAIWDSSGFYRLSFAIVVVGVLRYLFF